MFKNRKLIVTMDKVDKDQFTEIIKDPQAFEKRTDIVVRKLESVGKKVFAGICIFVILDTYRQVKVAEAQNPER